MRRYHYLHLDVFADRPFSGNQLAVFPEADGLDANQMQQFAAELAFSESSFVFPPETDGTDVRVRIFTPGRELPMAGHPTIGTAFALAHARRISADAGTVTMGLGVGPTVVTLEWERRELRFAWMSQPVPVFGAIANDRAMLAQALGVGEHDFGAGKLPVQQVSSGVPFLFVPLATRAAVNRVAVERAALRRFFDASGLAELPLFVFTLEGEARADDAITFSRMFAPVFGIAEDPATGGACGPLGGYLVHYGTVSPMQARRIVNVQGVALGRPSRIVISVATQNGRITGVRVGGTSLVVGGGFLEI